MSDLGISKPVSTPKKVPVSKKAEPKIETDKQLKINLDGNVPDDADMWSTPEFVTPEMAEKWLLECPFDYQRFLKTWHVDNLTKAMNDGEFRPTSQIILAIVGPKTYMIDGQHRLRAVVKHGKPVRMNILRYRVGSLEEVKWNYAGIDVGIKRNIGDALVSLGIQQKTGMTVIEQKAISAAYPLLASGFESAYFSNNQTPSIDRRVRFILQWADEGKAYFSIVGGSTGTYAQMFRRSPVVAVALITFRYQPNAAANFWKRVISGEGLVEGDPEKTLTRFLIDNKMSNRTIGPLYAKRIASAWNGSLRGEKRKSLRGTIDNFPITIVGTPYKREKVLRDDFVESFTQETFNLFSGTVVDG